MTEKLLHYIWQFQYFNHTHLVTIAGEALQIISPGLLNKNQGPDFLNAKIKIGDTVLVGTVELHLRTSDWKKHNHSSDPNFKNVILHVVYQHDNLNPDNNIPVLELQHHVSTIMLSKYASLMQTNAFVACGNMLHSIRDITWLSWKERLLAERLTRKSEKVLLLLKEKNNHWEEVFWIMLARSFGTKVNADAFEAMARSVSVTMLAKQKNSIHQIEALFFGQAGLLKETLEDHYYNLLKREYQFLQKKFSLAPVPYNMHFLRMRPQNFPTIRLAQLAILIYSSSHLFSKIVEAQNIEGIQNLFTITANDYWHYHYRFGEQSEYKKKVLGRAAIDVLIINSVVPILFAYGVFHKDEGQKGKALQWLEALSTEKNTVIEGFKSLHVKSKTAFDSQALLELKTEYCNKKRCLECSVGNSLLRY